MLVLKKQRLRAQEMHPRLLHRQMETYQFEDISAPHKTIRSRDDFSLLDLEPKLRDNCEQEGMMGGCR